MKLSALVASISPACAVLNALPDIGNYTKIPDVSLENLPGASNWMYMYAPDTSHPGIPDYTSNRRGLGDNPDIMTAVCDAFSDACDWHNGPGGAVGKRTPNASVTTYLRNSAGTFEDGSVPGSRYFVSKSREWCDQTVAWVQPATIIAYLCDSDPECDGFIMRNDDTYGALCKFPSRSGGGQSYFKLP
jgi:hypothetical protein